MLDSELPFSCWSKSKIQLATASFCDYVCNCSFRRYLWNHINEENAYCIESLNSRVVKLSIRCSSASWSIQRIEFLCMLQIPNQVVGSILAPCSWIDLTLLSTILVRCSSHDLRYGKGYWSDPNHQIVMLSWLSPGLCMVSMDWGKSKDDAVPGSDGGTPNGTIIIIIWWDCSSTRSNKLPIPFTRIPSIRLSEWGSYPQEVRRNAIDWDVSWAQAWQQHWSLLALWNFAISSAKPLRSLRHPNKLCNLRTSGSRISRYPWYEICQTLEFWQDLASRSLTLLRPDLVLYRIPGSLEMAS